MKPLRTALVIAALTAILPACNRQDAHTLAATPTLSAVTPTAANPAPGELLPDGGAPLAPDAAPGTGRGAGAAVP